MRLQPLDGILGHKFIKRLESFAPLLFTVLSADKF
jgi:hypothetical protein